jgi:hypothetical protein
MSEQSSAVPASSEPLFSPEEVKQFDCDDAEAGHAIGKMLSILFFYTVIVMAISAAVTYYWVNHQNLS